MKTKLEIIIFEQRDMVRKNLSTLLDKVEDDIMDTYMNNPSISYIRVNLDKVISDTYITVKQLEANLDLIYTALIDKGWRVNLFVEDDEVTQYLVVSV